MSCSPYKKMLRMSLHFSSPPPPLKRFQPPGHQKDVRNRAGNSLIWFRANCSFLSKNERMSDSLKKRAIHSFTHFWWAKWAICSHRSFPLSDLSKSLMVAHFWWAKWAIRSHRSFDLSKMSDSLTSLTKKRKWTKMSDSLFFRQFL